MTDKIKKIDPARVRKIELIAYMIGAFVLAAVLSLIALKEL